MQKELTRVKEELKELLAHVADLEEQVADLTAALTREAAAKVNTQEELSRVGEALEVSMASAEDLRRQCEEQALALDEHEERADWLADIQNEMREVNLRNTELETRNADLEWGAARYGAACLCVYAGPVTAGDAAHPETAVFLCFVNNPVRELGHDSRGGSLYAVLVSEKLFLRRPPRRIWLSRDIWGGRLVHTDGSGYTCPCRGGVTAVCHHRSRCLRISRDKLMCHR